MRYVRGLLQVGALYAFGAGASVLAQVAVDWEWGRSEPTSKTYTIETPCTQNEVSVTSIIPLPIGASRLNPATQVVCIKEGLVFAAGTTAGLEGELPDGQKAFDLVIEGIQGSGQSLPGGAYDLIDGRRAIQNREVEGDVVAQTTVIELSDGEVLMMLSGGPFDGSGSELDVDALIDRHTNSLEITQ